MKCDQHSLVAVLSRSASAYSAELEPHQGCMVFRSSVANVFGLLAIVLLGCTGCNCHHWCHLPDDCAHALRCTPLCGKLCNACCSDLSGACCSGACCDDGCCGTQVCDEAEPCCLRECCLGRCCSRLTAGPPPESYKPPMPPKFLPVPARPVFTNVNMAAPTIQRGQVEMGFADPYRHELHFPAGD